MQVGSQESENGSHRYTHRPITPRRFSPSPIAPSLFRKLKNHNFKQTLFL